MPSAEIAISEIGEAFQGVMVEIKALEQGLTNLGDTAQVVESRQLELNRLSDEHRRLEALAARAGMLEQAEQRLSECASAEEEMRMALLTAEERHARDTADARQRIEEIGRRIAEAETAVATAVQSIETELAALPPAFGIQGLQTAQAGLDAAKKRLQELDSKRVQLARQEAALNAELAVARGKSEAAARIRGEIGRLEQELGHWSLLGKALGNDGVIALCVDDAGPELARLANELLLACYGPRFTVSIYTQIKTAKKELREGFDVIVFDADTGQARSVSVMSGGERVWVNESLTRAIAIYLARVSGQAYETLFCDEADGALDPDRKRIS